MKALQDLEIFVRTADNGSLSATARSLDMTPAATSASLKRLELELGVTLFVRSTRSLRLTREGEMFLTQCRPALCALRDAAQQLNTGQESFSGVLKLAAPSDFGRNVLMPWLEEFQTLHPHLSIRLQLSDRLANVYSEPVDAAFRYGEPPVSNLVALPVATTIRRILCASPDYLQKHGTPATPHELSQHDCLCFMFGDETHDRWQFWRDGEELTVRVRSANVANDGDAVRRWALAGRGIAYKAGLDVARDLATGRLQALCTEWTTEAAPLYLVLADRHQATPALRRLREFVEQGAQALAAAAR